jgi:hypothetical protein
LLSCSMATSACAWLVLMPSMEDTMAADGRGTHNGQSTLFPQRDAGDQAHLLKLAKTVQ